MARRKLVLAPAEWPPLTTTAFAHIVASLGSGELAAHRLLACLKAGAMQSAMLRISDDGTETCERLAPDFWNGLRLTYITDLTCAVQGRAFPGRTWFFVRRRDLDKLYPVAATASTAASPPVPVPAPEPVRRKPGKQPTHDWPTLVTREVKRIIRAGEKVPSAASLALFCQNKLGYLPDVRAVQRLLRNLL
jgi:hypothetical protein